MASINDYKTPRDRINGSFLEQLLREETQMDTKATFVGVRQDVSPCRRRTGTPGCSCKCSEAREQAAGCRDCETYRRDSKSGASLAMVYSPFQEFTSLYCEEEALSKGSLFEELYLPFEAYCCGKKNYGKCGGVN